MVRITKVMVLQGYCLELAFDDGVRVPPPIFNEPILLFQWTQ